MTAPLSPGKTSLFLTLATLCVINTAHAQVTSYAIVPNNGNGTVSIVDTANATVTASPNVGGGPFCAATTRGGRVAYVATNNGSVTKVDVGAGAAMGSIPVGTTSTCLVLTPDDQKAYVLDGTAKVVNVLDLTTDTFTGISIPVGTGPVGIDITPDGSKIYVANGADNTVSVISTATNTVVATIPVGANPYNVAVTTNGAKVYVDNNVDSTLSKIDVATDTVELTIPIDAGPSAMVVSPDGLWLYVSCGGIVDAVYLPADIYFTADFSSSFFGFSGLATTPNGQLWGLDLPGNYARAINPIEVGVDAQTPVGTNPMAAHPFIGPNVIGPVGVYGPLVINSDADLTAANFPAGFVNFHGGMLQLNADWTSSRTVSLLQGGYLDTNGHNATLSGPILGGGLATIFEKDGNGRLTFSGPTTFITATSVVGGEFEVLGVHPARVIVWNASTLRGTGTVGDVDTAFATAGTVQPGTTAGIGTLTAGAVQFGSGTALSIRINGLVNDLLAAGTIDLNDATLNLTIASAPPPGATLTIATSGTTVTGTFHNLPEGSIVTASGLKFRITYVGGGGSHIVLAYDAPASVTTINDITRAYTTTPASEMVNFTVADDFEPVASVTATSSNQALVPDGTLSLNHVCSLYSLAFMPAMHQSGTTTISVTVLDSAGNTTVRTFHFTINDAAPALQPIPNQTIHIGDILNQIPLTASDDLTDASSIGLTAISSNQALLPNGSIQITTGTSRMLSATPTPYAQGQTTITVTATDGTGHSTQQSFTLTVTALYFLAEGATNSFFDTDILIANPNPTVAAVTLTFYKSDGSTVVQQRTLAATSRTTIHVKEIAGLDAASFATAVDSTNGLPLVVERTMTWDSTGYGSHGEKASAGAATTWYFAEGSQGYFHTYFLLLNQHAAANVAHVAYLLDDGSTVNRDYVLAPTSRTTVDLAAEPMLLNRSFGATITFDLPGMAERAMYFGESPLFSGGHDSAGVNAPATSWFLAEGATGSFFDTFVLVANPGDTAANVTMTYLPASGAPVSKPHTLAPHQRLTVNIATEDPTLASAAVATSVASDLPVIVERSQYWPHANWYEAHNSAGETSAGLRWGLAEGRVGGTSHAQTYVLIANPGAQDASITATFLRSDGSTIAKTLTVPALSRVNLAIAGAGSDVPELADEEFGTVIESTQPVIVERSMYTDANGVTWAAGTNATATRLP